MNICLFVNLFYHLSIKYLLKTNLCVKIQFVNKPPPRRAAPQNQTFGIFCKLLHACRLKRLKKQICVSKSKTFCAYCSLKTFCVYGNSYLYAEQEPNVVKYKSLLDRQNESKSSFASKTLPFCMLRICYV